MQIKHPSPREMQMSRVAGRCLCLGAALWTSANIMAGTFTTDFTTDPGGTAVGTAEVQDGVLKLTDLADLPPADPPKPLPQNGSYILPDFNGGAAIQSFTATFKSAVGGGSSLGAQGFSFVLGNDLPTDTPFRESGGWGGDPPAHIFTQGLIISFDTIDNLPGFNAEGNDPGDAPGIIVKVGGSKWLRSRSKEFRRIHPDSTAAFASRTVEVKLDADGNARRNVRWRKMSMTISASATTPSQRCFRFRRWHS
jgi:hypothetical protein